MHYAGQQPQGAARALELWVARPPAIQHIQHVRRERVRCVEPFHIRVGLVRGYGVARDALVHVRPYDVLGPVRCHVLAGLKQPAAYYVRDVLIDGNRHRLHLPARNPLHLIIVPLLDDLVAVRQADHHAYVRELAHLVEEFLQEAYGLRRHVGLTHPHIRCRPVFYGAHALGTVQIVGYLVYQYEYGLGAIQELGDGRPSGGDAAGHRIYGAVQLPLHLAPYGVGGRVQIRAVYHHGYCVPVLAHVVHRDHGVCLAAAKTGLYLAEPVAPALVQPPPDVLQRIVQPLRVVRQLVKLALVPVGLAGRTAVEKVPQAGGIDALVQHAAPDVGPGLHQLVERPHAIP